MQKSLINQLLIPVEKTFSQPLPTRRRLGFGICAAVLAIALVLSSGPDTSDIESVGQHDFEQWLEKKEKLVQQGEPEIKDLPTLLVNLVDADGNSQTWSLDPNLSTSAKSQVMRLLAITREANLLSMKLPPNSSPEEIIQVSTSGGEKPFDISISRLQAEKSVQLSLFLKLMQIYSGEQRTILASRKDPLSLTADPPVEKRPEENL